MLATQSKGLHPSLSSGLLSPIHVRKPHSFLAVINHHINGIIATGSDPFYLVSASLFSNLLCLISHTKLPDSFEITPSIEQANYSPFVGV